jgi:hypothetical protein
MSTPEVTQVEFVGIPSGDHESFCWDVTPEVYARVTGEEPPDSWGQSFFHEGMVRLYPGLYLPSFWPHGDKPLKVTVRVEESGGRRVMTLTTEEMP